HKRNREQPGGERILLEWSIVGVLLGKKPVGKVKGPAEVGGVLMKMFHQKPAERTARNANRSRNCNAPSHGVFHLSCNMKTSSDLVVTEVSPQAGSRVRTLGKQLRFFAGLVLALVVSSSTWFYMHRVLREHQLAEAAAHDRPRGNLSDLYPRWLGARELLLH